MMARLCVAFGIAATTLTACGGSSTDASPDDPVTASTAAVPTTAVSSQAAPTTVAAPASTDAPETTSETTSEVASETTSPSDDTSPPESADNGVRFESPDGRFAVDFAEAPSEQEFGAETTDGTPITVLAYLGTIDGGAGVASCVDVGEIADIDADTVLDEAITQALANFGAELDRSATIELQGREGREFAATGAGGPVVGRAFLDGAGVCQVIGLMTGDVDGADFVESFEFLEAAA